MSIPFLIPFLCALALLVVIARTIVYRKPPHDLDQVILFVRKLDVSDLETLLDAGEEWTLQQALTPPAFRDAQEARMQLVREYLRRVAHNVDVIQHWVAGEYELIKEKERDSYTEKDRLVAEALQVAVELRMYWLAAAFKLWVWTVFRVYRWPRLLLPPLANLKVQCGVNVLAQYRRLTEVAGMLSLRHGSEYRDRLFQAL
ncbi:MAG: hypothetical protein ACM3PW_09660 [Chlamydiota bacterium]